MPRHHETCRYLLAQLMGCGASWNKRLKCKNKAETNSSLGIACMKTTGKIFPWWPIKYGVSFHGPCSETDVSIQPTKNTIYTYLHCKYVHDRTCSFLYTKQNIAKRGISMRPLAAKWMFGGLSFQSGGMFDIWRRTSHSNRLNILSYFVHLRYDDRGFRVFAYQCSEYAVALCHNLTLIALRSIHNFFWCRAERVGSTNVFFIVLVRVILCLHSTLLVLVAFRAGARQIIYGGVDCDL